MIYEVEVSEQADRDLRGIFELQSPENARRQLDRLEEQILSQDILPVDNYVVLYIPDIDKKVVTILRVMYVRRDIDNQLNLHTKQ